MSDGFARTTDGLVRSATPPPKKKPKKVKLQTRDEVESQLKKIDEAESRLTKEASRTQAELSRLQENYEKEHLEGKSAREEALAKVKDSDKSALDSVQQVKSDVHIQKVIGSTKKYLGDLYGEIKLGRMKKDRLNRELKNISRIEIAEELAKLAPAWFESVRQLVDEYNVLQSKGAQLVATGKDWDKVIDRMVSPFEKMFIDSVLPHCGNAVVAIRTLEGVGGAYAEANPCFREYADRLDPPHKHLRAVRDHYGVNPKGQMTDGGIKV
jgi:hypothetical protein